MSLIYLVESVSSKVPNAAFTPICVVVSSWMIKLPVRCTIDKVLLESVSSTTYTRIIAIYCES